MIIAIIITTIILISAVGTYVYIAKQKSKEVSTQEPKEVSTQEPKEVSTQEPEVSIIESSTDTSTTVSTDNTQTTTTTSQSAETEKTTEAKLLIADQIVVPYEQRYIVWSRWEDRKPFSANIGEGTYTPIELAKRTQDAFNGQTPGWTVEVENLGNRKYKFTVTAPYIYRRYNPTDGKTDGWLALGMPKTTFKDTITESGYRQL